MAIAEPNDVDDRRRSSPPDGSNAKSVVAGRYEIVRMIGRGGCAYNYEARDLHLDRAVALKIVREQAKDVQGIERLEREVRCGAAVHHPNVCAILDAGYLEDGRPFSVMERLHGETL